MNFKINLSKGSGDMEQMQRIQEIWSRHEIERVNPMTLKCDLDLESG